MSVCTGTHTCPVSLTTLMLKSPSTHFGEHCLPPVGPRHPWVMSAHPRPPSASCCPPSSVGSCPRTGGSHSRSKEILCKRTGSQRRQDSGQAWQGVCVNSSEHADSDQRGWSQQKAFPGRQERAVHLRSLASGRLSRTWCTWCKADKLKSPHFYFLAQVQGDSPALMHHDSPLPHITLPTTPPRYNMTPFSNFQACSSQGH